MILHRSECCEAGVGEIQTSYRPGISKTMMPCKTFHDEAEGRYGGAMERKKRIQRNPANGWVQWIWGHRRDHPGGVLGSHAQEVSEPRILL